jgi:hypothetical protein
LRHPGVAGDEQDSAIALLSFGSPRVRSIAFIDVAKSSPALCYALTSSQSRQIFESVFDFSLERSRQKNALMKLPLKPFSITPAIRE